MGKRIETRIAKKAAARKAPKVETVRAYAARELERDRKKRERALLKDLRARIREAKRNKREGLRQVTQRCKQVRRQITERAKAARQALREAVHGARTGARSGCATTRESARTRSIRQIEELEAQLREERSDQRLLRKAEKRRALATPPRRAREKQQEAESEVMAEIPSDLHGVWQRVKHRIMATPRASRAEVFAEWAQHNPSEVWAIQQEEADEWLRKMEAEERRLARSFSAEPKKRGRKRSVVLDDVPF